MSNFQSYENNVYNLNPNLLYDYLMEKVLVPEWAKGELHNFHEKCYFYRKYTVKDLHFEACECNGYLYNYLTCLFHSIMDSCPDSYLVESSKCQSKYGGIFKSMHS